MGFWQRLFGGRGEAKALDSAGLLREVFGGRESYAGKLVTVDTALEDATAYACMRVISEGFSQVPVHVYQAKDGRKALAKTPLDDLLYRRPNPCRRPRPAIRRRCRPVPRSAAGLPAGPCHRRGPLPLRHSLAVSWIRVRPRR